MGMLAHGPQKIATYCTYKGAWLVEMLCFLLLSLDGTKHTKGFWKRETGASDHAHTQWVTRAPSLIHPVSSPGHSIPVPPPTLSLPVGK